MNALKYTLVVLAVYFGFLGFLQVCSYVDTGHFIGATSQEELEVHGYR